MLHYLGCIFGFLFSIIVYLVILRMMWFCALHVHKKKEIPALFSMAQGFVVLFCYCRLLLTNMPVWL